jgi:hypothetical protein
VSEEAIAEIVDDFFLPLVRPAGEARTGTVPWACRRALVPNVFTRGRMTEPVEARLLTTGGSRRVSGHTALRAVIVSDRS